jgi:hypothetical protein
MFREPYGRKSGGLRRLIRNAGPALQVHAGYPGPVDENRLVVARPGRQGRDGVKTRGTSPVQRYWKGVPRGMSMHTPGMSRAMLSRPFVALRQISPSPERTNQYSSIVRKRQARPTIPGGTVEWIMLPRGPSIM